MSTSAMGASGFLPVTHHQSSASRCGVRLLLVMSLFLAISSSVLAQQPPADSLASIGLPAELDRVLRDYEKAWQARDAEALAGLFTEDGFVLSNGKPPVRGRVAIRSAYADAGGPLALRALEYSADGAVAYIIGAYSESAKSADIGKFILALRKDSKGRWLIAADIDNTNRRPRPAAPAAPPTH